ncbi:TRAP transporter small permease [Halomonas sp. M4R1S46]|uniref:TRAP transporter small permease n=1 Tax=Halomonas sp. M4R1S46 TaxID=2982692 RepID=UPI0021E374D4|nr:TRAP transporter small permease [Halomonas sp. M4R1S46]UYG09013.1 TRAP transporter small permease [Halomonas sp. M4R1S46]
MKLSEESHVGEVAPATSLMMSSKNAIYQLAKWVAILSIVIMFLSLMTGVIVRYVLSTNLGWVTEIPNLFFPWLTMSAIVAAAARNEHIGIDLIVDQLPVLMRKPVLFLTNALAVIAFGLIAYRGLDVVNIAGSQRLPITQVGMSWAYWSVVAGFAAMAVVSLANIGMLLTGREEHAASQVPHGEEEL